jgi:hypothetical protein
MSFGAPSITTPGKFDLRVVQAAVSNIRRRIEILEAAVVILQNAGGGASADATAAIAALQAQITALNNLIGVPANAALTALMAGADGIVVHSGTSLIARSLTAGANITITYPDGVAGNPVIASTASGGGDSVLYDDTGRAILTDTGHVILTE